jgi:WD40 repeat protein
MTEFHDERENTDRDPPEPSWQFCWRGRRKGLVLVIATFSLIIVAWYFFRPTPQVVLKHVAIPTDWEAGFQYPVSVAISPDGKYLAAGSAHGMVMIQLLATGSDYFLLNGGSYAHFLCFSPDSSLLAVSCRTRGVTLLDMKTKSFVKQRKPVESADAAVFLPDGKRMAVASHGTVKLWDFATGNSELVFDEEPARHPKRPWPTIQSIAVNNEGDMLAIGIYDAVVFLNLTTGKSIAAQGYETVVKDLVFTPDGRTVAGLMGEGVALWDPLTAKEQARIHDKPELPCYPASLAISPDGRYLAIGLRNHTRYPGFIRIWQLDKQQELLTSQCHPAWMWQVTWSPDSKTLASCGSDGVKLWEIEWRRHNREHVACTHCWRFLGAEPCLGLPLK